MTLMRITGALTGFDLTRLANFNPAIAERARAGTATPTDVRLVRQFDPALSAQLDESRRWHFQYNVAGETLRIVTDPYNGGLTADPLAFRRTLVAGVFAELSLAGSLSIDACGAVRITDVRVDDQAHQTVVDEVARESGRRLSGWIADYELGMAMHEAVSRRFVVDEVMRFVTADDPRRQSSGVHLDKDASPHMLVAAEGRATASTFAICRLAGKFAEYERSRSVLRRRRRDVTSPASSDVVLAALLLSLGQARRICRESALRVRLRKDVRRLLPALHPNLRRIAAAAERVVREAAVRIQ